MLYCLGISFIKGGTKGKLAVLGVLLLIVVTDQTGYRLLKEFFERPRPCNALTDVLTPLGCTGSYSFPSNHALNNFAAAMFFYRLVSKTKMGFIYWSLISCNIKSLSWIALSFRYFRRCIDWTGIWLLICFGVFIPRKIFN